MSDSEFPIEKIVEALFGDTPEDAAAFERLADTSPESVWIDLIAWIRASEQRQLHHGDVAAFLSRINTRINARIDGTVRRERDSRMVVSDMLSERAHKGLTTLGTGQGRVQPGAGRTQPSTALRQNRRRSWFGLGAGLAFVLALAGLWRVGSRDVAGRTAVGPSQVYRTANGQYATIILPDGSRVTLAPATTISLSADFGRDTRVVTLSGEAEFTVGHDARTPFLVHTGLASVRVLGTTFVVRKYTTDREARVAVRDGRVALRSMRGTAEASGRAILSARMLGVVGDSGVIRVTPGIAIDELSAFIDGRLVFRNALVRDILPELNRAYDADIHVADSVLGRQPLTLTVATDTKTLKDVLDVLLFTLDAHATYAGRVITIVPGRQATLPHNPLVSSEKHYGR